MLKYKFPTYKFIKSVNCPVTIFHGTEDQVVPYANSKKLLEEQLHEEIALITIDGANHNNIIDFDSYHKTTKELLSSK